VAELRSRLQVLRDLQAARAQHAPTRAGSSSSSSTFGEGGSAEDTDAWPSLAPLADELQARLSALDSLHRAYLARWEAVAGQVHAAAVRLLPSLRTFGNELD